MSGKRKIEGFETAKKYAKVFPTPTVITKKRVPPSAGTDLDKDNIISFIFKLGHRECAR